MLNKPLLSIHILTYNHEKYIEECIDSIFAYPINHNIEIVISDDASQDSTPEILQKYQKKYPDIINLKINTKNKGIIKNYFDTLNRCKGEFYFDISGDDFFNPNAINIICEKIIELNNLDFLEFEYDEYFDKTGVTSYNINSFAQHLKYRDYLYNIFIGKIWPMAWCIKTSIIKKIISANELIQNKISVEDYPIAIELLSNGAKFKHLNISVMTYRRINTSISNLQEKNKRINFLYSIYANSIYYLNKYNLPKKWNNVAQKNLYISLLHTAGLYGDSNLGNKMLLKLFPKYNFKIILYYLSSQITFIRKIIAKYRKIN